MVQTHSKNRFIYFVLNHILILNSSPVIKVAAIKASKRIANA